jgi:hypothetical protein
LKKASVLQCFVSLTSFQAPACSPVFFSPNNGFEPAEQCELKSCSMGCTLRTSPLSLIGFNPILQGVEKKLVLQEPSWEAPCVTFDVPHVQGNCSSNHYNALSWARALGALDGKSASSALENPYVLFDIPHEQRHYRLGQYKNRTGTVRKAQIMVVRAFRHDGVLHRSELETLDSVFFIEKCFNWHIHSSINFIPF